MVDLRKMRENRNLTQRQVGEYVGCANSTISRYESGKQPVPYDILCKLADLFGVSPSYIMESDIKGMYDLTLREIELIHAFREADPRAQFDAYKILSIHKESNKFE